MAAMIDPGQLLEHVIRPTLKSIDLWSDEAERLLLGTACKESECGRWLVQLGGGPALGIYQMEPATEIDCWNSYIQHRPELARKINYWRGRYGNGFGPDELVWNLHYATAMCRVKYLQAPEKIADTLEGQAQLWKLRYNTPLGAGTVDEYIAAWRRFIPAAVV